MAVAFGMKAETRFASRKQADTSLLRARAVELIRQEIVRQDPRATNVNAVLIDFFLYDLAKEREAAGKSCRVDAHQQAPCGDSAEAPARSPVGESGRACVLFWAESQAFPRLQSQAAASRAGRRSSAAG